MSGPFSINGIEEFIENERRTSDGGETVYVTQDEEQSSISTTVHSVTLIIGTSSASTSTERVKENSSIYTQTEDSTSEPTPSSQDETKSTSFISCNTIPLSGYLSSEQSAGGSEPVKEIESFCRICHEVEEKESFISPCKCKGTISSVHKACIERWLAERDTNRCEICGFRYNTVRVPKYGILKALYVWLTSEDTQRDRREVTVDIIGSCLFAPLASTGTYVSFILADALESIPPNENDNVSLNELLMVASGRMAMLTVISLLITIDVAYATWIAIRIQNHISNWYSWYRRKSMVTLLPPSDYQHE